MRLPVTLSLYIGKHFLLHLGLVLSVIIALVLMVDAIELIRRSFDKKGIMIKKKGILQSMVIKEPLSINYEDDSMDDVIEKLEYAIEQHPSFLKVLSPKEIEEYELLNKQREW